ncbi:SDR family oxidoreductase [Ferrimonas pelagia]|uniref:SDR family oxidoreductase n=1 Tax=Ferrimonas pelagia TaxID=1177826 RepID=A0ABP9ER70_9GAMM
MAIYAMTGGATGIGAAIKQQLRDAGHELIVVDIKDADILADLSTTEGRDSAVAGIIERSPHGLDGFVACAGLGPAAPAPLLLQVNYFGAKATLEGLREHLAKKQGSAVLIGSNSGAMPHFDQAKIDAMLADDEAHACALAEKSNHGQLAYLSSKRAITQWMRRNATAFARAGVRLNAVAPGFTQTPLTDAAKADPELAQSMAQFERSIPLGRAGQPEDIANAVGFLLSEQSAFVQGSVLFVDGGSDAMIRPDQF